MAEALYRKYRPRKLSEVVGQQHIVDTLTKALKSGRIRHAYLFSGPKGVGKTSVARILAHEINKLPYKDDAAHLDIIEIDAASNRRIDEIRDLRDKIHTTPAAAQYKVYIIDEVHMLTREAFNALLKTLEEPPAHAVFILATTEAHKLPETIVSRTQHFTFRPVSRENLIKHLADLAKREKISITPDALELVADYEHGSVRDSVSLLDRLGNSGNKVNDSTVHELVGLAPEGLILQLLEAIRSGDSRKLLKALDELQHAGVNPVIAAQQLSAALRAQLAKNQLDPWAVPLMKELLLIPASLNPDQLLELCLLEATQTANPARPLLSDNQIVERTERRTKDSDEHTKVEMKTTEPLPPDDIPKPSSTITKFDLAIWPEVLTQTKKSQPSLYSALRLAKPQIVDDELILAFEFALHHKKLTRQTELSKLRKIILNISGASPIIRAVVDKQATTAQARPDVDTPDSLENISNIFDGAEVLES